MQLRTTTTTTTYSGPTRLYVGSLHYNITEEDLRAVFSPFGEIEFINIHIDPETNRSKGFGFVQLIEFLPTSNSIRYKRGDDAKKAMQNLNGLELAGRQLKVGLVNENSGASSGSLGELDDDGVSVQY